MSAGRLSTPNSLMHLCEAAAKLAGKRINTAGAEHRLGGIFVRMDLSNGMSWAGLIPTDVLIPHDDYVPAIVGYLKATWPEVFDEDFGKVPTPPLDAIAGEA